MKSEFKTFFLLTLLIGAFVVTFFVLRPFLIAIILAFILSQLFKNLYDKIYHKFGKRASLASASTCLIIFFGIFVPITLVTGMIINELNDLYGSIQQNNLPAKITAALEDPRLKEMGMGIIDTNKFEEQLKKGEFTKLFKNMGDFIFQTVKKTYQSASRFFFMIFILFFSLYYFFKDNKRLIKMIMHLSPLKNKQEQNILNNFVSISRATIKGTFVIALVQGTLSCLVLLIAGVQSPIIWAVVAFILSLLPFVGPSLVLLPISVILFFMGDYWQSIFVAISALLLVGTVDNFLRPKLVSNNAGLHPLLVFLSTLGGFSLFGFSGFILGPATIVFLISLLDIYNKEFKQELKKYNG